MDSSIKINKIDKVIAEIWIKQLHDDSAFYQTSIMPPVV